MAKKVKSQVVKSIESTESAVAEVSSAVEQALETLEAAQTNVVATVAVVKAQVARDIFNAALAAGTLVRKDVIAKLIAEAGLTKSGANTYYQNMRQKAGLVTAKVVAAASTESVADSTESTESVTA